MQMLLYFSAPFPMAGSHQAEMIDYKLFGLSRRPAECCWFPSAVHRSAASQQALSSLWWELIKPFQSHLSKDWMAKLLTITCSLCPTSYVAPDTCTWHVCTSGARASQAAFNCQQIVTGVVQQQTANKKSSLPLQVLQVPHNMRNLNRVIF